MDFCTLDQAKSWLKVTSVVDDELLSMLIAQTSEYIRSVMSRDLYSRAYTEVRDGNGADTLVLANFPATSVSSVIVASQALNSSEYVIDDMSITLLNGRQFTKGRKNISLSYVAGFAVIPADITRACMELVGKKYRERDRIGQSSKTLAGEIVSFTPSDMTDELKSVMRQYQRVTPI
jgi:Phage gp6-like head-tail connector protein